MTPILLTLIYASIAAKEGWNGPGTRGKAGEIGPYQITLAYWQDAKMPYGTHQNCEDAFYARMVMFRYWKRYCPSALLRKDVATLAAVHHWGPKGKDKRWHGRDDYVESVVNLVRAG